MDLRRLVYATSALLAIFASACTSPPPSVRGFEQPGKATPVAQLQMSAPLTEGMPAGSAWYIGASADGGLIGFLSDDNVVRWYRTR